MKKILMIQFFLFAGALFAAPVTYLDSNGMLTGTATTDGGMTTYRDAAGKSIGSSNQNGPQI
ncbi:MAG: hypothetical protein J5858_12460, partial [Lentisphaeria bacterium]|nr:hypothetical protein [Lentisphaeria bacterium]